MRPQTDKDGTVAGCSEVIVGVALAMLVCLLISLACSCTPQREVQIERVEVPMVVTQEHTIESVKIDHVRDTLIQRDSVYYWVNGDTVRIEKWHYLQGTTKVVYRDTLRVHDSIPYPVRVDVEKVITQTVEVEKPLSWWQKTLMWCGVALFGFIGFKIYRLCKK